MGIMPLRTVKERIYQSLAFELGGLILAAPLYGLIFGHGTAQSLTLLATLSLAVMAWAPVHNTLFDLADFNRTGRSASSRPHGLRIIQALSQETTVIVVTLPLVMLIGGHGFKEALMVDLGLTLFYAAYAYCFHIVFDWLRPIPMEACHAR
jgi:uncharacterized membrane protein